MGLELFDDDGSRNEDVSKIEINQEFARRYEHNKKREDLQRFEELKKRGLVSNDSGSESESDDDSDTDLVKTNKKDLEFFDALIKVKNQDPDLKENDVSLFNTDESEDEEEGEGKSKNEKKKKAMYLKDVVAKHLIEEGPEFQETEPRIKTYKEEQEELRNAFLNAVANEEEGDFLKIKERKGHNDDEDNPDDKEFQNKLNEYFGGGEEDLDENATFLKEYFMNKLWVNNDSKNKDKGVIEEELEEILRDEEEIEKQEDYEISYRYEENAGDRILGHARHIEGSVRKKTNARKEQRKSKEERIKIAEMEREEELKHLKNVKKKEMKERLRKISEIAGIGEEEDLPFKACDLEEDFDPEEYDRVMKKVFDNNYYDAEDVDLKFGSDKDEEDEIQKPDFEKEDELLGLPKGWDVCESADGFLAARERSLKHKVDSDDDEEEDDNENEEDEHDEEEEDDDEHDEEEEREETGRGEESKRKRKRKRSIYEKAKESMLEEYYKLDYEDTIGDLKTRFRYAKVEPNRYGLKPEEVLMMDEKELNQYVSLKKIAPYSEKEWKVPSIKRYQQKLKNKDLLKGRRLDDRKSGKKKRSKDHAGTSSSVRGFVEDGKAQLEESNGDRGNLSRRAKRRHRQAELKLSQSRLIAYGKIPPNQKGKGKQ